LALNRNPIWISTLALLLASCAAQHAALPPAPPPAPALIDAPAAPPAPVAPLRRTVSADMERTLDRVFLDDTRDAQTLDPLGELERGDAPDPARFRLLFTPQLAEQQRALNARTLKRLREIDRDALGEEHRISYDVFLAAQRDEAEMLSPDTQALVAVRPFNHFGGFHVEFPQLAAAESAPLDSPDDFEARIGLLRTLPEVLAHAEARFREGMASGVVESRLTVTNMIAQIDAILAQPVEQSQFMAPVRRLPPTMRPTERRRIAAEFRQATQQQVLPAYRAFRAFLQDQYLPAAREAPGLSAMRGGERLYRLVVRLHTTEDLDPLAVHKLGLSEIDRIHGEMEKVKLQLGFAGPLPAFFNEIRTNPRYHPRTTLDLQKGFARVGARVAALVPRYFLHLPRTALTIQPYPLYRDRFEAGGGYAPGAPDGSKPGVFFYNTFDLKSRYLTGITTLYLHEGEPGHHFQISLAQENESLPPFQRFGGNTAFVEGWALYAETLGYEMGLFADPMQHWGTLDDEMLRAMRLVVDTGIHVQGWSRQQAIDYMLANSGIGRSDAAAEVDRYIANPGQAVAYKIGGLTIQRLRRKAETELGPRFDIRAFHDQVLGSGALPLPVLEDKVNRWIAAEKAN
jgi:uncharacterized protein (DUF885 family)